MQLIYKPNTALRPASNIPSATLPTPTATLVKTCFLA